MTAPAVRCCDDIFQKTFSKCFPSADIIGNKCTQLNSSLVMPLNDRQSSAVYFALSREFACIDPVKQKTCKYDFFFFFYPNLPPSLFYFSGDKYLTLPVHKS